MNRRDFLKILLTTTAASYVDYEQLLWIPGEKTIFIPSGKINESQIIALELERVMYHVRQLFDRDVCLWQLIHFNENATSNKTRNR